VKHSCTSVAAPVVSDAAAVLLQANRGPTPPLIKDILQCSAQSIPGASLPQRSAGLFNVDGAVRLPKALRTDVKAAIEAATIASVANLLATGQPMSASSVARTCSSSGSPTTTLRLLWVKKNVTQQAVRCGPNSNNLWPDGPAVRAGAQHAAVHSGRGVAGRVGGRQVKGCQDRRLHAHRHACRLRDQPQRRGDRWGCGDLRGRPAH
jgi:hypothetical protein